MSNYKQMGPRLQKALGELLDFNDAEEKRYRESLEDPRFQL